MPVSHEYQSSDPRLSMHLQSCLFCRPLKAAGPARERPRCLGAAIHTALHLLRELESDQDCTPDALPGQQGMSRTGARAAASGRVLVITTGPTTRVWPCPASPRSSMA